MTRNMNEQIVETLYHEAMELAEDVRGVFARGFAIPDAETTDNTRIALSIEGMRSTTRIMNVLAWLLNQRAYFSGELSARQLLRRNRLGEDRPSESLHLGALEPETRALIAETERLHARVARLDTEWREQTSTADGAVHAMQDRIAGAFNATA